MRLTSTVAGRIAWASLLLGMSAAWAPAQRRSVETDLLHDRREAGLSFDDVDFSGLYEAGRRRNPHMETDRLEELVRENIHFVFHNKLNRSRFLVTPAPRQVVRKIEDVLDLNDQLTDLLAQGRALSNNLAATDQMLRIVRSTQKTSRKLDKVFSEYFNEFSTATFLIQFPRDSVTVMDFRHFLLEAERISRLLTERLDSYFFRSAPSLVDVSDYRSYSVEILCESLRHLSQLTLKRIKSGGS